MTFVQSLTRRSAALVLTAAVATAGFAAGTVDVRPGTSQQVLATAYLA